MNEQRTDKSARPIWQTTPCPHWCNTTHHSADGIDSRECVSLSGIVPLTTEETLLTGILPDITASLDEVHVALEQGYREAAPRLTVYRSEGIGFGMSIEEAELLQEHLHNLIETARGRR